MTNYLRLPLFFALIFALTSFGPAAVILGVQAFEPTTIRGQNFYAAVFFSCFAASCALFLAGVLAIDIFRKRKSDQTNKKMMLFLLTIGVLFCLVGLYALFVQPVLLKDNFFIDIDNTDGNFLQRLVSHALLEVWMIGIAAVGMTAIEKYAKK